MAADSDRSPGAECVEGPDAADMRPKSKAYWPNFLVHRRLVGEEDAKKWVRCDEWDEGHQMDSRVHCYDLVNGFYRGDEHAAALRDCTKTRETFERRREKKYGEAQGALEDRRQVQHVRALGARQNAQLAVRTLPNHRCNALAEGDNLPFQAPPVSLVATYMDDVRQFPSKAGTVKTYLAAISSTCTEFGASPPCSLPDVKEQN